MTAEEHIQRLKEELAATQTALLNTRRELVDARCRLALISKVVRDNGRVRRSPGVTFGAVRAALYARSDNLGRLGAFLPPL